VMEWVSLVKQHMPNEPGVLWNCTRFMLAAMNVEYYGLRDDPDDPTSKGVDDDEWKIIQSRNLITPDEVVRVKAYKGFSPFLPVYWGLCECREQLWINGPGKTTQSEVLKMQMLEDKALKFRGHCSQIINQLKQPVPWPYFHILNLILTVALITLAYSLVSLGHIAVTFPVLTVYMIGVLGLKSVAVQLADPFGTDDVDFELEKFMKGAQGNAQAMLEDDYKAWGRTLPSELTNPLGGSGTLAPHVPSRKSVDHGLASMLSFPMMGGAGRSSRKISQPFVEITPGKGNEQLLNSQL